MYLSSVECVDKLLTSYTSIKIGDCETQLRRLITPSKRIITSDVCHSVIEESLKSLELNIGSPISFMKAGIPGENFEHILSFRRQVYITSLADDAELPSSVAFT